MFALIAQLNEEKCKDVCCYIGGSDDHHERTEDVNGITIYLKRFREHLLDETTLNDIRNEFRQSPDGKLTANRLRVVLESSYSVFLRDDDFEPLFNRMDVRKEGKVDFLHFLTYLSFEYGANRRQKQLVNDEKLLKLVLRPLPRKPSENGRKTTCEIKSIAFKPSSSMVNDGGRGRGGEYVTVNGSGQMVSYTPELNWKRTHNLPDSKGSSAVLFTGLLVLPDLNVVCASTADQKLRFYEPTKDGFGLCATIEGLPWKTVCLAYAFHEDDPEKSRFQSSGSKIAVGDELGDVLVLELSSDRDNPFRDDGKFMDGSSVSKEGGGSARVQHDLCFRWPNKANFSYGQEMVSGGLLYSYNEVIDHRRARGGGGDKKRRLPFRGMVFNGLHPGPVIQVKFHDSGKWFVSVTPSSYSESAAVCRVARDRNGNPGPVRYITVPDGFQCACTYDLTSIATGCLNGMVRLWDASPVFPEPAVTVEFEAHDHPVNHVFYDRDYGCLYTVSMDRAIRAWDVRESRATCLLTLTTLVGPAAATAIDRLPLFPAYFNQLDHVLVMTVGDTFVTVKCGGDDDDHGDWSHGADVVKTVYSSLYHLLVSVSAADSVICAWNPRTGRMIAKRSMAHYREVYCEKFPVQITTANFDPSGGLLITGAIDGTVHIWDPSTMDCLNRLQIPSKNRISEIIWLPTKILVTGRDGRVTEFNDPFNVVSTGKVWLKSHGCEVLSMCTKPPSTLVTTTGAGEIGIWWLETGQLIKMHAVRTKTRGGSSAKFSRSSVGSMAASVRGLEVGGGSAFRASITGSDFRRNRRERYAVVASHVLRARQEAQDVGTLAISVRNGTVQLWCTHKVLKMVAHFVPTHLDGDYVTSMASDGKSECLFTSLDSGYVKTWYVADFGQPVHVTRPAAEALLPALRLRFPFLFESLFVGRAERAAVAKNPGGPLLVGSYRAHLRRINHIGHIDTQQLVVTSGADMCVRLWTMAGHYVGTLGSPWPCISKTYKVILKDFAIPSDIRRRASFTTIKVLKDGLNSDSRTPEVWEKLKKFKKQREMANKEARTEYMGIKCPNQPLHQDMDDELLEGMKFIKDQMIVKVDRSKPKVQVFKHVPLLDLEILRV